MQNYRIESPKFIDLQKTRVSFKIIYENGLEQEAELTVPKNKERGINPHWDYITNNFDIEKMREERNNLELRNLERQKYNEKKQKSAIESSKLVEFFNLKISAFDLPFIKNSSEEIKSAIRRAPNQFFLYAIVLEELRKYMDREKLSYLDLFEELDKEESLEEDE